MTKVPRTQSVPDRFWHCILILFLTSCARANSLEPSIYYSSSRLEGITYKHTVYRVQGNSSVKVISNAIVANYVAEWKGLAYVTRNGNVGVILKAGKLLNKYKIPLSVVESGFETREFYIEPSANKLYTSDAGRNVSIVNLRSGIVKLISWKSLSGNQNFEGLISSYQSRLIASKNGSILLSIPSKKNINSATGSSFGATVAINPEKMAISLVGEGIPLGFSDSKSAFRLVTSTREGKSIIFNGGKRIWNDKAIFDRANSTDRGFLLMNTVAGQYRLMQIAPSGSVLWSSTISRRAFVGFPQTIGIV